MDTGEGICWSMGLTNPMRMIKLYKNSMKQLFASLAVAGLVVSAVPESRGAVSVPALFGNHMVLQRDQKNPVWGQALPGEKITVRAYSAPGTDGSDQSHETQTGADGKWMVHLDPMVGNGQWILEIEGNNNAIVIKDVLIGEVWVCSGQSNMQWGVNASNDPDLETLTAKFPRIRLITIPLIGTQVPQDDFEGQWELCTPQTVANFSAVGYFFGRQLHQTLDVPIGLIDNAWGGSSAEAWVRRDLFAGKDIYKPLLDRWTETEKNPDLQKAMADYETNLDAWKRLSIEARLKGQNPPSRPGRPGNQLTNQHRPGNLYNGVLRPIIGYGIRGVIWYQGESNAGRAYQYRDLFPMMIQNWRDEWGQGNFPFYWVQLADYLDEVSEPVESDWAELREAQTLTLSKLPHTGEAVIIDLGEAHDIHPKNKQDVAKRLARLALAQDYRMDIVHRSPIYQSMKSENGKIILKFDHIGGGLDTFDVRTPIGFTIAGEDRKFVHATAKITAPDTIEVSSESITAPVAVRYAWANNPVANVQNKEGLPLTPFRTDSWPGKTANSF